MDWTVCTVVTRNRLYQARALMRSVADCWPEAQRVVLLVDDAGDLSLGPEAEIVPAKALGLHDFTSLAFANEPTGLCCLLKPALVRHLLAQRGTGAVVYLDADMQVYGPPTALLEALSLHPVVLTPQALAPLPPEAAIRDGDLMRSGAFNAGCFAVTRSAVGERFLSWWFDNLRQEQRLEPDHLFDQRWLDLAPVFFRELGLLRDPGYDVAYWNLHERPLARGAEGAFTAGGVPLVVFHFSYFDPAHPEELVWRGPTRRPAHEPALRDLLQDYVERLEACGRDTDRRLPYGYDRFRDGKPITSAHRRFFHARVSQDVDPEGEPFDPAYRTRHYRGLTALHAREDLLPRLLRRTRNLLVRPPGARLPEP